MPLANMASVTPATRLLRANESQSVRAGVRFALRGDDETKSVRVSSPPDARGLGTDRSLQTATGAKRIGCRHRLPSASVVGSIVSCDARYQGSMPLAPSAPQPASSPP
jgi:hypothetical protein